MFAKREKGKGRYLMNDDADLRLKHFSRCFGRMGQSGEEREHVHSGELSALFLRHAKHQASLSG